MAKPRYLFLSGQDVRNLRKTSVLFIAEQLRRHGSVRFLSVGYSEMSRLRQDQRMRLDDRANQVEDIDGIEAFLQKTPVHPFRLPLVDSWPMSRWWMERHARSLPPAMRQWIVEADVIFLETGLSLIYFSEIKRLNRDATVIYLASDMLSTIGCSVHLETILAEIASSLDLVVIRSSHLRSAFPEDATILLLPAATEPQRNDIATVSPYTHAVNAVSVGSMIFDADVFRTLCPRVPEVHFHVIGSGVPESRLAADNLTLYSEMAFAETRRYIDHADVGIAPYRFDASAAYLADTSLKLVQFSAVGLPAVCPTFAQGTYPYRFGYTVGDGASIEAAFRAALACGRLPPIPAPTWRTVTDQIVSAINDLRTTPHHRLASQAFDTV
jgi:2-beta-glucuronyltransferase